MRRIALLILSLTCLLVTGCSNTETVKIDKYSDADKAYYDRLETFKNKDKSIIEKYINIYVKYAGFNIPEEELGFIKENTSPEYYNDMLGKFYNTFDLYVDDTINDDMYPLQAEGGYFGEDEELEIDDNTEEYIEPDIEENEGSNNTVTQILYNFKNNTYIVKVGTPSGISYIMYVKVKDGKVVDIYAY